ncbi:uncharacterized protein B0H18DRAFT_860212, partial [Fomitopsis serialis]|uniref:uncharacterized protein n=1 Tax=Fomitopsis serialis TaxID=139415 RepID=UPI00200862C4
YLPREEARVHLREIQRLHDRESLTLMTDGWEDKLKHSVYGTLLAEVGFRPAVLGLEDLSGQRATADCILTVVDNALKKKEVSTRQVIALVTDNPTTMVAFRRKYQIMNPWTITLYCFLHGLNTIIGKIASHPVAKAAMTKNARLVSYFNQSHYWGGQLEEIALRLKITRGMKTNFPTRFYGLVLQAVSVQSYKATVQELCLREDAQRATRGLTPVSADVISICIRDITHWDRNDQLIRICKPMVDAIGNLESRDANLADCMLELIWAERAITRLAITETDDVDFAYHAKSTV